ncbi:MAG: hypothetical protein DME32_02295 [Verrucomicrobia bacterium]|nr:MAG: hypothetical protein DME32_02295 [Verrucomicrobiota bacterium]
MLVQKLNHIVSTLRRTNETSTNEPSFCLLPDHANSATLFPILNLVFVNVLRGLRLLGRF